MNRIKRIFTLVFLLTVIGINVNYSFSLNDYNEKDHDLISCLIDNLSDTILTKTTNIFWCKDHKLFIEPFPIENYSFSLSPKDLFNKGTKYDKIFTKYFYILNDKIKLDNQEILQNYITNICNKKITDFDKNKILELYNNLTNYIELSNVILSNYIDIYNNIESKEELIKNIDKFKNNLFKLGKIKEKLQDIKIIEIDIDQIKNASTVPNSDYINLKIIPRNNQIKINGENKKLNFINLQLNKKHFYKNNINDLSKISKIFLLAKLKTSPFIIQNIYTFSYE